MPDDEGLIIRDVTLEHVSGPSSPPYVTSLPEYALVGRSNVGKSSLINMILSRRIARTSSKPGKTRTINYYLVNRAFYLVDLPGYGFAHASKREAERIALLCESYLAHTATLRTIYQLVDIRHRPTALDITMREWILSAAVPQVTIATKADKLGKNDTPAAIASIRETLSLSDSEPIIAASSLTGAGREEILRSFS